MGISIHILFLIYFSINSWLIVKEKAKKMSENINKLHALLERRNFDLLRKF